jgi:hypothetical protein
MAKIDTWFVARKLGVSDVAMANLLATSGSAHAAYPTERSILDPVRRLLPVG